MQWLLTVSASFSLTKLIGRSSWLIHSPFSVDASAEKLYRIERLQSGQSIALVMTHLSAGVSLHCESLLSGRETEEVSQKVWRMLRLGENLQVFIEKARLIPALSSVEKYGARFLRGSTFFEDVVKSVIIAHLPSSLRSQYITWLVDNFGDPLLGNPTLHTFPEPQSLLEKPSWLRMQLGDELGEQIIRIAEVFQTQSQHVRFLSLRSAHHPLSELKAQLQYLFALDDVALGLTMLSLGRYDYVPADFRARCWVSDLGLENNVLTEQPTKELFDSWQPWGGLAYWLWDWDVAPKSNGIWKGESTYGELEDHVRAY